jgi:hypothetical protein
MNETMKIQNKQPLEYAVCPKLSAIAKIWDNDEKHMVSCMDDYFKQGIPEIEIAICNNETGEEIISAKIKSENFYKSESYLRCFPNSQKIVDLLK